MASGKSRELTRFHFLIYKLGTVTEELQGHLELLGTDCMECVWEWGPEEPLEVSGAPEPGFRKPGAAWLREPLLGSSEPSAAPLDPEGPEAQSCLQGLWAAGVCMQACGLGWGRLSALERPIEEPLSSREKQRQDLCSPGPRFYSPGRARGFWREMCPSWTPGLQGVRAIVAGPWLPAL